MRIIPTFRTLLRSACIKSIRWALETGNSTKTQIEQGVFLLAVFEVLDCLIQG